jgi:hypothetical protein
MQCFVNQPPYQLGYGAAFPKLSAALFAVEPSLHAFSEAGVALSGGVLAKTALKHIQAAFSEDIRRAKNNGLSATVDARVQHLGKGMYPAAPGWHCDYVPCGVYNGQPNFSAINPQAFSVAITLSTEVGGVSLTEFVIDPIKPRIFTADDVYRDLDEQVTRIGPRTLLINDGVFVKYTPKTIHRATETHRRGVRMVFRFTMCNKPPVLNELPKQQQVYVVAH